MKQRIFFKHDPSRGEDICAYTTDSISTAEALTQHSTAIILQLENTNENLNRYLKYKGVCENVF